MSRFESIVILFLILVIAPLAQAQCQIQQILSQPPATNQRRGTSVAIDGDLAIIGGPGWLNPQHCDPGLSPLACTGAVEVIRFDSIQWQHESYVLALDGHSGDKFGQSVDLSGEVMLVGAPHVATPDRSGGAAYIFRFDGDVWHQEARFLPCTTCGASAAEFGRTVALSGNVAAVSRGIGNDWVEVFRFNDREWIFEQAVRSTVLNADDQFGVAIALEGDRLLVGAPEYDEPTINSGAVAVFQFDGEQWVETELIQMEFAGLATRFGSSLDLNMDSMIARASLTTDLAQLGIVFRLSDGDWQQETVLTANHDLGDGELAVVAIESDIACIGLPLVFLGQVHSFRYDGLTWSPAAVLEPEFYPTITAAPFFGAAIDIDGESILSGAPRHPYLGDDSGIVFAFSTTPWDCDADGVADPCDDDCNQNGAPDRCDIADGTSADCDNDGVPDECNFVYQHDDGESEINLGSPHEVFGMALNNFIVQSGQSVVTSVAVSLLSYPSDQPMTIVIYDDPNDDGEPSDAELLLAYETSTQIMPHDAFLSIEIPPTYVGEPGESFFTGVVLFIDNQFLWLVDQTEPYPHVSYTFSAPQGVRHDVAELAKWYGPSPLFEASHPGVFMIRVRVAPEDVCAQPADLNGDGSVGFADLLLLLDAWGACDPKELCSADLDASGAVGFADLLILLDNWS